MKRKVDRAYTIDIHGNIHYPKEEAPDISPPSERPLTDTSLDDIGKQIINALERAVKKLSEHISGGDVSREVVGALKDCQQMLKDLKKDEKDFLSNLSDEDLEKLSKK